MHRFLVTCLGLLLAAVSLGVGHLAAQAPRDDKTAHELARTLDRWHSVWSAGRIDLDAPAVDAGRVHPLYRGGALFHRPKETITHREAIRRLFDAVPSHATLEVALATLAIAATDLGEEVDPARGVLAIRSRAREALGAIEDSSVLDALIRLAGGDRKIAAGRDADALRLAALLTLGRSKSGVARIMAERQLDDGDRLVRLAAAETLLERGDPRSIPRVADRFANETDAAVCQTLASTLARSLPAGAATLGAAETRRAVSVALAALGRIDWRVDVEIVELCRALRCTDAIPALIAVLERTNAAGLDEAGNGFLVTRAHEVLKGLTGAIFGPDEPGTWRAFWERERATFEMPPPRDPHDGAGATSSGFFGIPIQGRRVLFLIDRSGSMGAHHAPLGADSGTSSGKAVPDSTRLAWAKHELLQAVDGLPRDAFFDVIIFSGGVDRWRGSLTPATEGRRKALREQLAVVEPGGGTNIWGALERALDLRSVRWGDASPAEVDEIFLLSDGEPSVGAITHTQDILDAVRESNRLRRVRIHTIYMGPSDSSFMQQLAAENSGRYVRTGR